MIPYDFHVHCGCERSGVPQARFIQTLRERGIEFRRPDTIDERYLERPEYITNCFHIDDAPDTGSFGERAGLNRSHFETVAAKLDAAID